MNRARLGRSLFPNPPRFRPSLPASPGYFLPFHHLRAWNRLLDNNYTNGQVPDPPTSPLGPVLGLRVRPRCLLQSKSSFVDWVKPHVDLSKSHWNGGPGTESVHLPLPKRVGNWVGISNAKALGIVWRGKTSKNAKQKCRTTAIVAVCAVRYTAIVLPRHFCLLDW